MTNRCFWPPCQRQAHPKYPACAKHWFRLPENLRAAIEKSPTDKAALMAAENWMAEWLTSAIERREAQDGRELKRL